MAKRIAAAQACQQAGYIVRVRFSPIIPIRGWQEENAEMLAEYFRAVRPDIVTMDMLKWIEPTKARANFDVSLWDEEYLSYIDKYAKMKPNERPSPILPNGKQLFPDEARLKIYRFFLAKIRSMCPSTPVALCGETPEMWQELGSELGMNPNNYVCACGPTSVPGHPLISCASS